MFPPLKRSLPKIDALSALLITIDVGLVAVTKTWLKEDVPKDLVSIDGLSVQRRDRPHGRGVGVGGEVLLCLCLTAFPLKDQDLENPSFECMWVWLRPHRLQRPLSSIITAVVYCPPDKSAQDRRDLVTYLSDTIDIFRFRYPDCGIVILGDFNGLDTSDLSRVKPYKSLCHPRFNFIQLTIFLRPKVSS